MAATIVTAPELKDYPIEELTEVLARWTPNFAQRMDRGAGDLVGNLEDIEEHELWRRLGYSSMEEYLLDQLGHTQEWCDDIIRIYRREWTDVRRNNATVGELYSEAEKIRYERDVRIHAMRDQGMTQQEIADAEGVVQKTVSNALVKKPAATPKITKPMRIDARVRLSPGTNPMNAASRIREKLGDEFARQLLEALQERENV